MQACVQIQNKKEGPCPTISIDDKRQQMEEHKEYKETVTVWVSMAGSSHSNTAASLLSNVFVGEVESFRIHLRKLCGCLWGTPPQREGYRERTRERTKIFFDSLKSGQCHFDILGWTEVGVKILMMTERGEAKWRWVVKDVCNRKEEPVKECTEGGVVSSKQKAKNIIL